MTVDLISLAVIALVAVACPIVAKLIPNKLIPETVFLLIAGALLGPNMANVIVLTDSVGLLSDLGLAFLFLLAGYEINPKSLTGSQGKRGLATWCVSIVLAFLVVRFTPFFSVSQIDGIALVIALTTTALGTLMPILKERGLTGTRVGESILAYGTWGELCPVLAMALLLSTRAEWKTVLILLAFVAISVIAAVVPAKAKKAGHGLFRFLTENAEGTSQTMMRTVVLLLVGLVARDQMTAGVYSVPILIVALAPAFGMYSEGLAQVVRFFPIGGMYELVNLLLAGDLYTTEAIVPIVVTLAWIAVTAVAFVLLFKRLTRDN